MEAKKVVKAAYLFKELQIKEKITAQSTLITKLLPQQKNITTSTQTTLSINLTQQTQTQLPVKRQNNHVT